MNSNVFILMGNWFERTDFICKIKSKLINFDLDVFDDTFSWEYVKQSLLEYQCFGEKRLIIINSLPIINNTSQSNARTKILKELPNVFSNMGNDKIVVLNGIDISSKSFLNKVKKIAVVKIFDKKIAKNTGNNNAVNRMIAWFENSGKKIDKDIALSVINSINYNETDISLDRFYLLIKQIEHIVAKKKNITFEDIYGLCSNSEDFLIWNLLSSFDHKNIKLSLQLIDNLYNNSLNFKNDINMAISTIIWKMKVLLFTRCCLNHKIEVNDIWNRLSLLKKQSFTGQGSQRYLSSTDESATLYSRQSLNMLFYNNNGKTPIACYKEEELWDFLTGAYVLLSKIRSGIRDNEIKMYFELFCLMVNRKIPNKVFNQIVKIS